jgi:multicomponent Na+:H+ antiporter subunit F
VYYVVTIAILLTMALALARALLGPSVYDRVLAVNMLGTKTVLLLSIIAFLSGRPDFLDLALAYALINFIGVLAVLEFFKSRARRRNSDSTDSIADGNSLDITENSGPARLESD